MAVNRTRGTQSFVHVLGECWSRPSLLALELAVALALRRAAPRAVSVRAAANLRRRVKPDCRYRHLTSSRLSIRCVASEIASAVYAMLAPPILRTAFWLVPVAILTWAIVSGIGRNAVLRRLTIRCCRRAAHHAHHPATAAHSFFRR